MFIVVSLLVLKILIWYRFYKCYLVFEYIVGVDDRLG